jgi:hypothetical protein
MKCQPNIMGMCSNRPRPKTRLDSDIYPAGCRKTPLATRKSYSPPAERDVTPSNPAAKARHPAHGSTSAPPDQALPDLRQAGAPALSPVLLEALRRHRPPPLARRPLRGPGGRRGRERARRARGGAVARMDARESERKCGVPDFAPLRGASCRLRTSRALDLATQCPYNRARFAFRPAVLGRARRPGSSVGRARD